MRRRRDDDEAQQGPPVAPYTGPRPWIEEEDTRPKVPFESLSEADKNYMRSHTAAVLEELRNAVPLNEQVRRGPVGPNNRTCAPRRTDRRV